MEKLWGEINTLNTCNSTKHPNLPKTYSTSDLSKILYGKQKSYMLNEKYFEYQINKT